MRLRAAGSTRTPQYGLMQGKRPGRRIPRRAGQERRRKGETGTVTIRLVEAAQGQFTISIYGPILLISDKVTYRPMFVEELCCLEGFS